MAIIDSFAKATNLERVTKDNGGALLEAVEEIAKTLGIEAPDIYLGDKTNHALFKHPQAAALGKKGVIISKPLLEMLEEKDIHKSISEELKFVVGHEMHHNKNFTRMMMITRIPALALPAAAIAATMFYDHSKAKAAEEGKTYTPQEHADTINANYNTAKEDLQSITPNTDEAHAEKTYGEIMLNAGRYIAIAGLGLGAGLYACRVGSHYNELAADKFGAEVAGTEAGKAALTKLHSTLDDILAKNPAAKKGVNRILNGTIMYHPTLEQRIKNIEQNVGKGGEAPAAELGI